MTRFLRGRQLWEQITKHVKSASRTRAAIAYVTKSKLLDLKRDDTLIVDATDKAIASAQTSAAALADLHKKGVLLYSHKGLHAKFVISDHLLFCSSANLSESSFSKLLEAEIITDVPICVSASIGLIESLRHCSDLIDDSFIARIAGIKVTRKPFGETSQLRSSTLQRREEIMWLLGTYDVEEPKDKEELARIERGRKIADQYLANSRSSSSWIRYPRKGRVPDALCGDCSVMIHRGAAADDPKRVYQATILRVQAVPNCTRVYYEQTPNEEKVSLTWTDFQKLWKLAGETVPPSKNAVRRLKKSTSENLLNFWEAVRSK